MLALEKQLAVELEAALAAVEWKREFARELHCEATKLARASGANMVRLDHIRQALPAAVDRLLLHASAALGMAHNHRVQTRNAA